MNSHITALLYKSINDVAFTEAEKNEVTNWVNLSDYNSALFNEIHDLPTLQNEIKAILRHDNKNLIQKIIQRLDRKKKSYRFISHFSFAYAFVFIFLIPFLTLTNIMYKTSAVNKIIWNTEDLVSCNEARIENKTTY